MHDDFKLKETICLHGFYTHITALYGLKCLLVVGREEVSFLTGIFSTAINMYYCHSKM